MKIIFGLSGDVVTTTGSIIPNVLTTSRRRDRVAVAVKAMTPTDGGIRLLTSPSLANAVRNSSPLWSGINTCITKMSVLHITNQLFRVFFLAQYTYPLSYNLYVYILSMQKTA